MLKEAGQIDPVGLEPVEKRDAVEQRERREGGQVQPRDPPSECILDALGDGARDPVLDAPHLVADLGVKLGVLERHRLVQAEDLVVMLDQASQPRDEAVQAAGRVAGFGGALLDLLDPGGPGALEQGQEQPLLAPEVPVEGGLCDPRALADGGHRGRGVAAPAEQIERRLEDPLEAGFAPLGAAEARMRLHAPT